MKNYYKYIYLAIACFAAVWGCSKKPTDFRSFLEGQEIVYPGVVSNPAVLPGNGRLMLTWLPSPDPSISKYIVYWNNKADSVIISALSHKTSDTVRCLIDHLSEYSYTFFIYSYDSAGNKSVVTEIDNAQVYGPIYQLSLHNRLINTANPYVVNPDGSVVLNFLPPIDTINITTRIKYTNTSGSTVFTEIPKDSSTKVLTDRKDGATVYYQSSFIPKIGAIDTFYTSGYDSFPAIFRYVQCDKSLFKPCSLPNDVGFYDPSTTNLLKLWDGTTTPQGYPEIYHSDGGHPLPHHFTFDLGQVYNNLGRIEEIGRDCCNNPDDFEIWGIADTTGAETTLPGNNAGWKAEALAKGWTLLKEATRTDDGKAPVKFDFVDNPPPVRFIRIRIIHVTSGDANYSNISELTLWNKQ